MQLLFADASTGANSPALVRQGQISELIAAKPQNRRMILEEAGGVSGLHSRRHEAELRLRAAETNMTRLDDVSGELEATLGRLRREGRQAEVQAARRGDPRPAGRRALRRWRTWRTPWSGSRPRRWRRRGRWKRRRARRRWPPRRRDGGALPPLREEAQIAGAVLQRLTLEHDRLEAKPSRPRRRWSG